MRKYRAALIGIGGFGARHVEVLLQLVNEGEMEVAAFAEMNAAAHQESYGKLTEVGASHYIDYEEMLKAHPDIDFVVISTPIATHKPISIRVMELGFHVLVEKPPAVTIQDVDEMIAASQKHGKRCQVNFQMTSGNAFRKMLTELRNGAIGELRQVTGVGMWHRAQSYYSRTGWAGKLIFNGQYVLDGTFMNPLAHTLNNCQIAACAASEDVLSVHPQWVQAELYHVNDIEGDDVSCIQTRMSNGVEVNFYGMLCHHLNDHPYIVLRGSSGEMRWQYDHTMTISSGDRQEKHTFDDGDLMSNMYRNLMDAIDNPETELLASLQACRNYVLVANGAYESAKKVRDIPRQYVVEEQLPETSVRLLPSLSERMPHISNAGILYSQAKLPWAVATDRIDMTDYRHFELPEALRQA
ncbi:Gfo/Idh/MocA family oxidoreductase [Paenibacillus sp. J5C_2022]|uniref:Gfo/Idh/MocA family protein n=1 Tax=Paenibacillus sp. J5C2022 TaxID=2977129 RepID=UPI0021D1ABF7|nr:Gfo/Idh/MocA family oxidoreductase [Paenibacillus sp. J5C2022]MCU6712190.1 Gfo/Idh/MocA family oxidoreductase [Paenibacillus sp. J5C2022]